MEYCKICGKRLIGYKCTNCGKNYETRNIDIVKHRVKRHIQKNYDVNIPSTPIIVGIIVIVAIAIILSYFVFSNQPSAKTTTQSIFPVNSEVQITSKVTQEQKASLRIYHQMVNQIGQDLGCFGRVDGGVTNTGIQEAYNVQVTCSAEEFSSQKDLGSIRSGETKTFQILLDYDCMKLRQEECQVTCDNC
jgi:hypothetical protein